MVLATELTAEQIGQRAGEIRDDLRSGKLSLQALAVDPIGAAEQYGLVIPDQNKQALSDQIKDLAKRAAAGNTPGCVACDIGLSLALGALAVLLVGAVAVAVAVFAPEIVASVALAFLTSQTAFAIVSGVVMASAAALAAYLCHDLIKC
jgi:hypothetical protein